MLTFLNHFRSSFAQLLSSPSFTLLANKSVLNALNHCVTPSLSFDSRDDIQCPSSVFAAVRSAAIMTLGVSSESILQPQEMHLRHTADLGSLLTASLLKSTSQKRFTTSLFGVVPTPPPPPANSPSLTPSSSFLDSRHVLNNENFLGADSSLPSFSLSSSGTPTFDLAQSFMSDSSDCPDEEMDGFHLSNSPSFSSDRVILTPTTLGLGITGVSKHDGRGQFDGLGLVSISRWTPPPAFVPNEGNPFLLSERLPLDFHNAELSHNFLREAEMTFIQDPFHRHSLATIPECLSWSEQGKTADSLSVGVKDDHETGCALSACKKASSSETLDGPLRRMKKHFSASTISSELKRTTPIRRSSGLGGTRARASTWLG